MSDFDLEPLDVPPRDPATPRRGLTAATASLIVVMLVAGITSFAITSRVRSEEPFATATGSTPPNRRQPGRSVPSSDPDAAVLRSLGVQQQDVGAGTSVGLIPDGDSVVGTTTLDLCNGTYATERLRSARFQVIAVAPAATSPVLSTEPVLYLNPGAAAVALAEVRSVASKCPSTPVVSPVGSPTATTQFDTPPDGAWAKNPKVERQAYEFDTIDLQGERSHSIAVYLRRGRAFMGVYFASPEGPQPPVAGKTSVEEITRVFESRLAALPDAVVDRRVG